MGLRETRQFLEGIKTANPREIRAFMEGYYLANIRELPYLGDEVYGDHLVSERGKIAGIFEARGMPHLAQAIRDKDECSSRLRVAIHDPQKDWQHLKLEWSMNKDRLSPEKRSGFENAMRRRALRELKSFEKPEANWWFLKILINDCVTLEIDESVLSPYRVRLEVLKLEDYRKRFADSSRPLDGYESDFKFARANLSPEQVKEFETIFINRLITEFKAFMEKYDRDIGMAQSTVEAEFEKGTRTPQTFGPERFMSRLPESEEEAVLNRLDKEKENFRNRLGFISLETLEQMALAHKIIQPNWREGLTDKQLKKHLIFEILGFLDGTTEAARQGPQTVGEIAHEVRRLLNGRDLSR